VRYLFGMMFPDLMRVLRPEVVESPFRTFDEDTM
jgi:hypothetical protein